MKSLFCSVFSFAKFLLNRRRYVSSISFIGCFLFVAVPPTYASGGNQDFPDLAAAYSACQAVYAGFPSNAQNSHPCSSFGNGFITSNGNDIYQFRACGGPLIYFQGHCDYNCPSNTHRDPLTNQCIGNRKDDLCPKGVGNPINAGSGNKIQQETDYMLSSGALLFQRTYRSDGLFQPAYLGNMWMATYDRTVTANSTTTVLVTRPDGTAYTFTFVNNIWTPDADIADRLTQQIDGAAAVTGWTYRLASDDSVEMYNAAGKLINITSHSGQAQTLTYTDGTTSINGGYISDASGNPTTTALPSGLLLRVTDDFNRTLSFSYDAFNRIVKMTDPVAGIYHYAYDLYGNLISVTYPDNKTRTYVYNESANTFGADLPNVLTGIIDENNNRFATWKYDTQGRAISSEHNLPGNVPVEKVSIAYTTDTNGNVTSSAVTDALNTTRTYSFTNVLGVVKNTGVTQPCSSGCGTASATTYDANGNIASKTDFNGNVTNYIYDLTRNLETSRTEAYGTSLARTITTQWHATYRLPTLITEPGKTTTFTYDTSGNVLTKTIKDTALNKLRTWTYTYNSLGQVLTADGPRTDVSDVTTYTYYPSASNTAGSVHSIGDLATVTNAVGLVTSITNYDLNGRPLSITDPNGVVTTLTYWPRGWLKTRTVNGVQTTSYDYDGVGQLTQVTLPDNSALKYTYDTAHRLTDIQDGYVAAGILILTGNKIHYTLDAMGNRLQEETKDPSSTILKTRSRVFDALNRLQKDIGGTSPSTQITQYGYDNNGNLKTITDPLNHITTNGYDALNRLITVTDPANGVSTTGYNALDQTTQVKDPRLVTTNYTVNALGDVTLTQSPDSGNTSHVYDAAGNLTQKTDARGIISTYTYDALNRLTSITYPSDANASVSFAYDDFVNQYYRKGRLSAIYYGNNMMAFTYDAYGNLKSSVDWAAAGQFSNSYLYDNANRLQKISSGVTGRKTIYTRNALGQITQVQTQDSSTAPLVTVVSNVSYEPFGPIKALTFGNGATTTITHDADYRIGRITTTSTPIWDFQYSYDNAGNVLGVADQGSSTNDSNDYAYDNLNRVLSDRYFAYQYDAGSNRTQRQSWPSAAITQQYAAASNKETTYNGGAMTLDVAGNVTQRSTLATSYNAANQLSQSIKNSITTTYQYNGFGWRNTKQGTQATHYDYAPDGKLLAQIKLNADNTYNQSFEYLWLDDTPIAQIKTTYAANNVVSSRRLTYIHADHLNTPRVMTDATKTVVWKWTGDAYGAVAPNANPDGDSTTDTLDLRFPGQIADSESGLYYNLNRYYDPLTARYTQSDPIGLDGGLNTYGYVGGNPISRIDPSGLCFWDACAVETVAASAVVSAVVGIVAGEAMYNTASSNLQEQIEREANKNEYKNICDEPPPPNLDPCELAKWKLNKAQRCKAAREENTNRWWDGKDNRHNPQLHQDLENAIRNAQREVERLCKCQK
jgi:RHS repeat-associated protein